MKDIDPRTTENMIADGATYAEIASALGVDRSAIYKRMKRDPELRDAVNRGKQRRENRRVIIVADYEDTGDEIEATLRSLLSDVQSLRRELAK